MQIASPPARSGPTLARIPRVAKVRHVPAIIRPDGISPLLIFSMEVDANVTPAERTTADCAELVVI